MPQIGFYRLIFIPSLLLYEQQTRLSAKTVIEENIHY